MAYPGPPQYGPPGMMPPPFGPPPPKRDKMPLIIGVVIASVLLYCGAPTAYFLYEYDRNSDIYAGPTYSPPTPRTAEPTNRPTTEPTAEPTAEPTSDPTGAPVTDADAVYEGRGDKVVRLKPLNTEGLHFATVTHRGSSNVAIWALDKSGKQLDLMVNEIGDFSGNVPVDFRDVPTALKVEADGSWKIVVKSLSKAPRWPDTASGKQGEVLLVTDAIPDDELVTVKMTHTGKSNFVVYAYGGDYPDLLVNEIGRYDGEVVLPKETVVVTIEGDGAWTMKRS